MNAKLVIREAEMRDIPTMSEIRLAVKENVLSNPERITLQMYEDYLDKLGKGWVCEIDGLIVGFSNSAKVDSSIWALFILPEYEGRGIGKVLLQHAVDWLFAQGNQSVTLSTEANTRADKFYQEQGWIRGEVVGNEDVEFTLLKP